jgi:hypothetical protein
MVVLESWDRVDQLWHFVKQFVGNGYNWIVKTILIGNGKLGEGWNHLFQTKSLWIKTIETVQDNFFPTEIGPWWKKQEHFNNP